jgi:Cysteine rich repeat
MKTLTLIAALLAALTMTHSAFAANPLAKACAADIKAQCADVKPGGGKLKDCVKAHFSDLSADCQVAIIRAAAEGRACKADAKKLCADAKGGQQAKLDCLKEHAADLSDDCKQAMAKAEAGNK